MNEYRPLSTLLLTTAVSVLLIGVGGLPIQSTHTTTSGPTTNLATYNNPTTMTNSSNDGTDDVKSAESLQSTETTSKGEESNLYFIIGGCAAGFLAVVLLLLVVITVCVCRRRRAKKKSPATKEAKKAQKVMKSASGKQPPPSDSESSSGKKAPAKLDEGGKNVQRPPGALPINADPSKKHTAAAATAPPMANAPSKTADVTASLTQSRSPSMLQPSTQPTLPPIGTNTPLTSSLAPTAASPVPVSDLENFRGAPKAGDDPSVIYSLSSSVSGDRIKPVDASDF